MKELGGSVRIMNGSPGDVFARLKSVEASRQHQNVLSAIARNQLTRVDDHTIVSCAMIRERRRQRLMNVAAKHRREGVVRMTLAMKWIQVRLTRHIVGSI